MPTRHARTPPANPVARRTFLTKASAGTAVLAIGGGLYVLSDERTWEAQAQTLSDGRPRLPPGQRVIERLKPMGDRAGSPSRAQYTLKVHGDVQTPFTLGFRDLVAMAPVTQHCDVHCVTGWSVLGTQWTGIPIHALAQRANVKPHARHVIFEAHGGYTANVRLRDALAPNALLAWDLDQKPLARQNGAPVRAVVPDLYFWKSAKWLTGIRFVRGDEPGFWEVRGYHNRADPWKEERYG